MRALKFQAVAEELLPFAIVAYRHLRTHGYRLRVEVLDPGAPFAATITAIRASTALHVEVVGVVNVERLKEWLAYGKSTGRDIRLALCIPSTTQVPAATVEALRAAKVGLFVANHESLVEVVPPVDLALNIELPRLEGLPTKVRELLGPAYEKFGKGEWRECFEEACNALEEEARRYLKRWSRTERIKVHAKGGGSRQLTAKEINSASMGQLADKFALILAPNQLDTAIERALRAVNPDRVVRTHRRRDKRTEKRLRRNAGSHLWHIVKMLGEMAG